MKATQLEKLAVVAIFMIVIAASVALNLKLRAEILALQAEVAQKSVEAEIWEESLGKLYVFLKNNGDDYPHLEVRRSYQMAWTAVRALQLGYDQEGEQRDLYLNVAPKAFEMKFEGEKKDE